MTNKTIDFLKVLHLRGPNIWTYRSVLEAWVDIHDLEDCPSNVIPGLPDRLTTLLPTLIEGLPYEALRDLNDEFTRTDNELVVALDNALRRAGFDGWGLKVYHPKAKGDERRIYAPDPNPPKKHLGHGTGLSTVVRVDV